MKLMTNVEINDLPVKINIKDSIFTMGSCFSEELSKKLSQGQLQVMTNPYGTLFNVFSIQKALDQIANKKMYEAKNLIKVGDRFVSLNHHSFLGSDSVEGTLLNINTSIQRAYDFLSKSRFIILTLGTSFVHEFLPSKTLVANCHKIPGKYFKKHLLTTSQQVKMLNACLDSISKIAPKEHQVLLSLSPVRHTKDGHTENQRSKSRLHDALLTITEQHTNVHYIPVYELMMDELRDYRFYKEDMIHPSQQAIDYIWAKFQKSAIDIETQDFLEDNYKIKKALEHRPQDSSSQRHRDFLDNLKAKIKQQQAKVNHPIFQ